MAMADYKIRVIANACITRYERGENDMNEIINSYNLDSVDQGAVLAYVYAKRPDIETMPVSV
ncbi:MULTISPECIES: hypothetical protein [Paenibacillus]|uniref:hypothetical protein n=1 Tax=Paenibacillus TaxID=44249 RepID=UPI000FD885F4|nr:hypothetical protein [Paenibacillus glycanilyticus]